VTIFQAVFGHFPANCQFMPPPQANQASTEKVNSNVFAQLSCEHAERV
jgi:hypothetical protein